MTLEVMASTLVIGSSGPIGVAICDSRRRLGSPLIRLDRVASTEGPEILVDLATGDTNSALGEVADLSQGPIHIVHAGGGASRSEIEASGIPEDSAITATIDDNLVSVLKLLRWVSTRSDVQTVTVLSSINSLRPFGLPAYSATKGALAGLLASEALPLAQRGTRFNLLTLGTVDHASVRRRHAQGHFEELAERAPLGRFVSADDVANAIEFIISNESMCGSDLRLDCGTFWST